MRAVFACFDQLLRGGFTRADDLRTGRLDVPLRSLALACVVAGVLYGACMGLFAALRGGPGSFAQLFASALKVPLLFLLTLIVTFPSLYVFSTLFGSRLRLHQTFALLLLAIAVDLAVLASFGPVTAFFTLSTQSYPFMLLLNVVVFAIAGWIGLGFLRRAVQHVFEVVAPDGVDAGQSTAARRVFGIWLLVYGLVGAQMGWVLRPFVGSPDLPFSWFRARESNFFDAVLRTLRELFGSG